MYLIFTGPVSSICKIALVRYDEYAIKVIILSVKFSAFSTFTKWASHCHYLIPEAIKLQNNPTRTSCHFCAPDFSSLHVVFVSVDV